jgi:hypothetical protein
MKEIVIVSCYPNTEYKERLLNECVSKLKSLNKEVLIATHYPVPDYIVKKAEYYIYDSNNIDFKHRTLDNSKNCFVEETSTFRLEFLEKCHSPSLSRVFNLALNFVKYLEYDYFTIIESDSEYEVEDLAKLSDIKDNLVKSNKSFFFFKLRPYQFPYWESLGVHEVYETYCFGGLVYKFLEKFNFPKSYNEWVELYDKDYRNQHLEFYVSNFFSKIKDECLILDSLRHVFDKSNINLTTVGDPTGVYYNINDENVPIIFLMNNQKNPRRYVIRSPFPHICNELTLNSQCWWFSGIEIKNNNQDITITIYEDEKVISRTLYVISKTFMDTQKQTNRIKFK